MATKSEELTNPESCLNKAADDEPIFVLRAQDVLAAPLVRHWAMLATVLSPAARGKVLLAMALADAMDAWALRTRHLKLPD